MEKIENATKLQSSLKVGVWLLVIHKDDRETKGLIEILKFINNFEVIINIYKMWKEGVEKEQENSNPKDWDFKTWDWYKLTEKEITKWKKIILLESL